MMKYIIKVIHSMKSLIFPALILLILVFMIQPTKISGQSKFPKLKNKYYIVIDKIIRVYTLGSTE